MQFWPVDGPVAVSINFFKEGFDGHLFVTDGLVKIVQCFFNGSVFAAHGLAKGGATKTVSLNRFYFLYIFSCKFIT